MPRKDPKGDVRTNASSRINTAIEPTSASSDSSSSAIDGSLATIGVAGLDWSLSMMMARDDGWLRVVPHVGESLIYAKWKFTVGRWTGYYVMYRCDNFSHVEAITGLHRKLQKVDRGELRPVYDTPYNS
jgi:hypothetical protein